MCGRYTIISSPDEIRHLFDYADLPNFPPRYNIAPTQPVPIVRLEEGKRRFALVRWGLIPTWVKDLKTFTLLINARGETLLEKPSFRNAVRRRRCLFPADGFYEWMRAGERKTPHYISTTNGGPMAFAGLWETWIGPNGEEIETAAIVTTRANRTLAPLHDRMPAIITPDAFDFWLDHNKVDAETAISLIAPAPENLLEIREVSTAVNRTVNDMPALIEPALAASSDHETADVIPKPKSQRTKKKEGDRQASLF
ncbi:MAG TPA: SOS response-associated peptidase [Xanthobacteraceae bacterium]|jgi:putative SOS response-associated peptidase YedK|nr:SOS response-associated peptidase [Xanthobacteraceae bacterium]